MKIEFHIQPEQFEYIGFDYDAAEELTDELIQRAYNDYQRSKLAIKFGEGLPTKEWNSCLDRYRSGKGMDIECDEKMNKAQKWLIHELDKSDNRLKTLSNSKE